MNDYIFQLAQIDYISLLSAVAIIMVATVVIKEGIEKFCNTVGLEFSWIRARRERSECEQKIREDLEALKQRQEMFETEHKENVKAWDKFNKEVMDCIEGLKNEIKALGDHIEKREAEKRFKKLRYDILNFADRITKSESITAELVEQVFDEIQDYENLVEAYDFKNNRVNASMAVIQARYQELLMQGKIIKEDD